MALKLDAHCISGPEFDDFAARLESDIQLVAEFLGFEWQW